MADAGDTPPRARLRPGLVIALTVAAVMVVGIAGLIAAALFDDDDEPTGAGLEQQVDVGAPATAAPAGSGGASGSESSQRPSVTEDDDNFGDSPSITATVAAIATVEPVGELAVPSSDETLPTPGSAPAQFPSLVTTPAPPSTYAAIPLAELSADAVPALAGWTLRSREGDHVGFTDGVEVVDVFAVEAADAATALDWLYDRAGSDVAAIATPEPVRLGAPNGRFLTVLGSQFVATDAEQLATTTMSGSVVTAARRDGSAVVLAVSRPGTSSDQELAADGELLRAILAHL